jgi:adenine deaminase
MNPIAVRDRGGQLRPVQVAVIRGFQVENGAFGQFVARHRDKTKKAVVDGLLGESLRGVIESWPR